MNTSELDKIIDRRGTCSYKWDSRADIPSDTIPLWVADMDFKVCPAIIDALRRRVDHGVFGYTYVPDTYYEAVIRWFEGRHGWKIDRHHLIYTTGVVPAISAITKALTRPGDNVIVQTPVYNCFFSSIRNQGCRAAESPLIITGETLNTYEMDFASLEAVASDPKTTLMLLCNPHNPGGRVWTAEELRRVAEICARHGVTVVSDEIHCELTYGEQGYTPFALVAGECNWAACTSPSKAFNIAGLQIANIVCPDPETRRRIDRAINDNEVCDVNPFGVAALQAAYSTEGAEWLDALCAYIYGNYEYLREAIEANVAGVKVFRLEGTYLAWVDCRTFCADSEALEEALIHDAHVWVNAGAMYGRAGEGFIRVNLACPHATLAEGVRRLVEGLKKLCS